MNSHQTKVMHQKQGAFIYFTEEKVQIKWYLVFADLRILFLTKL